MPVDWHRLCFCSPMSIRIARTSNSDATVLRIAGRLRVEDVAELAAQCDPLDGPLVLDLSELQSADPAGVVKLAELVERGAQVRGASKYVELLLKREKANR